MVSQPFLYICVGQYTIAMVEVTTQEYVDNISYISTIYNRIDIHYKIKKKNHLPMVLQMEFARRKKRFPLEIYRGIFSPSVIFPLEIYRRMFSPSVIL
jgi:hypothetical protein